jgi:hypothetical protein
VKTSNIGKTATRGERREPKQGTAAQAASLKYDQREHPFKFLLLITLGALAIDLALTYF